jgi:hypothetical protein
MHSATDNGGVVAGAVIPAHGYFGSVIPAHGYFG